MKLIRLFLLATLILVLLAPITITHAQDQCTSVTILNESSQQIDSNRICEAASRFVAKGHQVFVFVTDESAGRTEDDWFAIRDRVETDWGIYNPSDDTFSKKAVSVELTTDTSKPWGQDLAFGEVLFGTLLDNDQVISQIEGNLKNQVAQGDVTAAIVDAFNAAYGKGSPPLPPTRVPVTPAPTVIVQGPTTNVQVDTQPIVRGIGMVLLIGSILVGGFFLVTRVAVPVGKKIKTLSILRNQAILLRQRLASLLNTLAGSENNPGLLTGNNPEETLIYALWASNGGDKYTKRDGEVREFLRRSQIALAKAFEAWTAIAHAEPPRTEEEWRQLVSDLEMLYLTVVGTTQDILGMTETEQLSLLDPMTAMPREDSDVQLVAQIDEIVRRQQGAGSLQIKLMTVNPSNVDSEGILGYIDQVKAALHELSVARDEGPQALESATEARQKIGAELQTSYTMANLKVFAYPDAMIIAAEKALSDEMWLEVKTNAAEALAAIQRIPSIVDAYTKAESANEVRKSKIQKIQSQGYRITPAIQKSLDEVVQDDAMINKAIIEGDFSKAEEYIRELEADCERALQDLVALVKLHDKNEQELIRLSKEVARVDAYRSTKAEPSWDSLKAYPSSNWQTVSGYFDTATKTLADLFDDPSNETDLASSIARTNSLEEQLFARAEQMLVEAFSQLKHAESNLEAVVNQLADVQKIEQTISAAISASDADITKAQSLRDADDRKIDVAVDEMITKAQKLEANARKAIEAREFTVANDLVNQTRQLANQAYASANEQARTIDSLYKTLESVRTSANTQVGKALTDFANLTPTAQKASTGGSVNEAQSTLRAATRAESIIAGEDQILAKTLNAAVEAYREAEKLANEALSRIRRDKEEYAGYVSSVQSAISSASTAISSANRYVRDSDSGGAGSSSLHRAQNMVPSSPNYGESIDALSRKRRAAEEAEREAENAAQEARYRIRQAEEAREAERRRREAAEAARRAHEAEEARRRASYSSSYSSSMSSNSFGSSSRSSSSFGSSSRSSSSSMGSSSRR